MPATESKQDAVTQISEIRRSWLERAASGNSSGSTLIQLGLTLASAKANSIPGLCFRCKGRRDERRSTSNFPSVFCSEDCEHDFIRQALASLSLEDCIRMQRRLDHLLALSERAQI